MGNPAQRRRSPDPRDDRRRTPANIPAHGIRDNPRCNSARNRDSNPSDNDGTRPSIMLIATAAGRLLAFSYNDSEIKQWKGDIS
jgi:hypothetical protein